MRAVEDDDLEVAPAPSGDGVEDDEVSPAAAATAGTAKRVPCACSFLLPAEQLSQSGRQPCLNTTLTWDGLLGRCLSSPSRWVIHAPAMSRCFVGGAVEDDDLENAPAPSDEDNSVDEDNSAPSPGECLQLLKACLAAAQMTCIAARTVCCWGHLHAAEAPPFRGCACARKAASGSKPTAAHTQCGQTRRRLS